MIPATLFVPLIEPVTPKFSTTASCKYPNIASPSPLRFKFCILWFPPSNSPEKGCSALPIGVNSVTPVKSKSAFNITFVSLNVFPFATALDKAIKSLTLFI